MTIAKPVAAHINARVQIVDVKSRYGKHASAITIMFNGKPVARKQLMGRYGECDAIREFAKNPAAFDVSDKDMLPLAITLAKRLRKAA